MLLQVAQVRGDGESAACVRVAKNVLVKSMDMRFFGVRTRERKVFVTAPSPGPGRSMAWQVLDGTLVGILTSPMPVTPPLGRG